MAFAKSTGLVEFSSGGFELHLPPTPFSQPPNPPRFVMLDDIHQVFYDVAYQPPHSGNTTPWPALAAHTIPDPAITFHPHQWTRLQATRSAMGFLVSINHRDGDVFHGTIAGTVSVQTLPQNLMNWAALRSLKGPELPAEMRAGLLRRVWNRRPGSRTDAVSYVTSGAVLEQMPRPWHRDGAALNWELDERFAGGVLLGEQQQWRLSTG